MSKELKYKLNQAAFLLEEINEQMSDELGANEFPLSDFRQIYATQEMLINYADQPEPLAASR